MQFSYRSNVVFDSSEGVYIPFCPASIHHTLRFDMFHSRVHIKAGDLVIIFIVSLCESTEKITAADHIQSRDNMLSVIVSPGEVFHNKYGRYAHDDMIGQKFGSKVGQRSFYVASERLTAHRYTLHLLIRDMFTSFAQVLSYGPYPFPIERRFFTCPT